MNRSAERRRLAALVACAAVLAAGVPVVAAAQSAAAFTVVLKPGPAGAEGRVSYVDVAETLAASGTPAGAPMLALPRTVANVTTVAETLQGFAASDEQGVLVMDARDAVGEAGAPERQWLASRAVVGLVTVHYRAPIDAVVPRRTGPPIALRTEGGGISGAGSAFLLMPVRPTAGRLAIRWDLSALGAGATGTCSFGDGDVDVADPRAVGQLESTFFMAGPLHRYPRDPRGTGFSSVWLGTPPFDAEPLMAWTARLYEWYRGFFKAQGDRPYRVFLRFNPVNPGGGVGLMNSFVTTYGAGTTAESVKGTLAHEMLHTFAPSLGAGSERGQWFSEGIAVYYQRLLPLRAGAIGPAAFLDDLNDTAGRYYTNILNTTPDSEIAARFWDDTRIRVLPYDRGSMYMAVADSQIRKASKGRRSIDDLVLALIERERGGLPNTVETWVGMISREAGQEARATFDGMLAGRVMVPDSDAFGPCFERRTAPLRRFELGFAPKVMNEPGRVIHDLVPGSEAERAGLRNGDEIVAPVGLDGVQGDQHGTLTLQIRRNGKVFPVTYLPRGETVDVFQWARKASVPDSACAY